MIDTLNINEYARFFQDPQCSTNQGRRVLTTVVTLTEEANLMPQWVSGGKRIVVAVLDETRKSCGRQPLPEKCLANQNAPGCVSSLCSSDLDCEGTLVN
jgi:hypothetical protein